MMPGWLSAYIIILTVITLVGCVWLLYWTSRRRDDESQDEVTGHVWDGDIEEYNNPLPRWWLWMFYLSVIFAVGYLALYPGLGSYAGLLNWTSAGRYQQELDVAHERYRDIFAAYAARDVIELSHDMDAMQTARRLFLNNCATCHGSDAGGSPGYPRLSDSIWNWGGDPTSIKQTISAGRIGVMPAFGSVLSEEALQAVAGYVSQLANQPPEITHSQSVEPEDNSGESQFRQYCAACHGVSGQGNSMLGAPNLADDHWMYGGSLATIIQTIRDGRQGQMPAHKERVPAEQVHLLAAYIYRLSQEGVNTTP